MSDTASTPTPDAPLAPTWRPRPSGGLSLGADLFDGPVHVVELALMRRQVQPGDHLATVMDDVRHKLAAALRDCPARKRFRRLVVQLVDAQHRARVSAAQVESARAAHRLASAEALPGLAMRLQDLARQEADAEQDRRDAESEVRTLEPLTNSASRDAHTQFYQVLPGILAPAVAALEQARASAKAAVIEAAVKALAGPLDQWMAVEAAVAAFPRGSDAYDTFGSKALGAQDGDDQDDNDTADAETREPAGVA